MVILLYFRYSYRDMTGCRLPGFTADSSIQPEISHYRNLSINNNERIVPAQDLSIIDFGTPIASIYRSPLTCSQCREIINPLTGERRCLNTQSCCLYSYCWEQSCQCSDTQSSQGSQICIPHWECPPGLPSSLCKLTC
jgi:hypothetical protein